MAAARPQAALDAPLFGIWKLNLAKSVYRLGPPPAGQTQTFERAGSGVKVSVQTFAGNGVRIAYGYTAELDGAEHPVDGEVTPNGAETVALARIDASTIEAVFRRTGEVVLVTRIQISADGKVLTLTSRGTNRSELPTNSVAVFDKQER